MARNIVIIGGGPAAVFAAIEAKKRDAAASVTLVTEESCEPYEKPPLSKAVLLGAAKPEDTPIAGPGGLAGHGVTARLGAHCTAIDRTSREVVTSAGRLPYDALVIATGSRMRELALLPPGMPRVHYLRTDAQDRALRDAFSGCKHVVVIGAGLIGLEVAASAVQLGIEVTVIEFAPRVMARACDEETGALILAEHQHHGVEIEVSTAVKEVTRQIDGSLALETAGGEMYVADLVVVGAGVVPDDALAAAAGLAPVLRQSGKVRFLRRPTGGNKTLKQVFYQSAFCSLHSPDSRAFYARKRREGKRHHQALIALARRRINVLWAMLQKRQPYVAAPQSAAA
jgi:NADPH-dependent 2,4-dienoyl-CoA reductase/sulfur reductase-like enzyme